MKTSFSFLLLLLGSALSSPVPEVKESNDHLLYPYGPSVGDLKNPKDDDGTSPEISTKSNFTFYGKTFRKIFVNNNGVVSFGVPVPEYTPEAIPLANGKHFVAPYWGDVNNILGGDVFYREVNDPETLQQITKDIHQYFPNLPFTCTGAFIATWDHVAYFGSVSQKTNTFQAVLITDGHISFIMLNYGDIQWTTGAASGGDRRTGLGGISAQAGFNSGDDKNYYSIPGSRTAHIIDIPKTSNVHVPGRWVFQVDDFKVTGVPEELQRLKEEEEKKAKSNEDQGPPSNEHNEAEVTTTRNPPEAEESNVSQVNEGNSEVQGQEVKDEPEAVPPENQHEDEQTQTNQDSDVNPEKEQEAKEEPEVAPPENRIEEGESQVNQVYENPEEKESQKQEENEGVSAVDVPELPVQKPELVTQINDSDEDDDDCE
ncbi:sushi, nidogen and EGF-like domain-containing protein 1 [Sphaerodactylus townsendi]|uniref:sushi, nidogen and EGF-like domain-containing protein 1 n=1 Tax=Sphaerodactylus townsendi TaxID=933632 RepID=UPI0020271371|nr:sushi, nidogen and EGF-like domain-containing protein 1 [Sphaerodactylus townsendi]XP_048358242.1 sushi, nidogen and EGF-like domain-containing protein 1 [Sphaerodactylus townsendi]XP_048358243.1 sushi, nidogen and EGF-like domain-containing protein 1 [Sphaerodactylus townsendi]